MALEPATMDPLEGPFNLDELRMWVSDTRKIASGKSFQVVRLGDFFDELFFGDVEKFTPIVGNILDAKKQNRFRTDLTDDLSISVINLPNGKMIMGVVNPVKKDAKFLIDGHPVVIDPVKPTMVIGIQYKDDLDNTGRGLFIVSQASDTIEPPKILTEPEGGTFLEGDVADVIATAIGYKDVIAIKNGDELDGIKAAALPVPILPDTADIFVFGFVHPKDPNIITWTQPVSIKRGEAEPAKISVQSQSQDADAGTDVILTADATGTPPPLIVWKELVNGQEIKTGVAGRKFTYKVLATRTFIPVAINRYKVDAGGKFDPTGEFKEFEDPGMPITVKKIGLVQEGPVDGVVDDEKNLFKWTDAPGKVPTDAVCSKNGSAFVPVVKYPLPVGDVDIEKGDLQVKYPETVTHYESAVLTNTTPYRSTVFEKDLSPGTKVATVDGFDQYLTGKKMEAGVYGQYIGSGMDNSSSNGNRDHVFFGVRKVNQAGAWQTLECAFFVETTGDVIETAQLGTASSMSPQRAAGNIRLVHESATKMTVQYKPLNGSNWTVIKEFTGDYTGDLFVVITAQTGKEIYQPREYGLVNA